MPQLYMPNPELMLAAAKAYQPTTSYLEGRKEFANIESQEQTNKLAALKLQQEPAAFQSQQQQESLANQLAALKVQQEPEAFQLQQQKEQMVNKAAQLALHSSQAGYTANRAADIVDLPAQYQEDAYQKLKPELKKLGIDTSNMDPSYTPRMQDYFKQMSQTAPQNADTRKLQGQVYLQKLKNLGSVQTAVAKAAGTPTPLSKSEATANSAYRTDVITNSGNANTIVQDMKNIQGALNKASTGYFGPAANLTKAEGQEMKKYLNQFVLDRFEGMKHIGRGGRYLMSIIKGSKPQDWMRRSAIQHIIDTTQAVSQRIRQKEQFTQFMWSHGIQDRGAIDSIWNKYMDKYQLVNTKTNIVNKQNVGKWAQFLQANPRLVKRYLR